MASAAGYRPEASSGRAEGWRDVPARAGSGLVSAALGAGSLVILALAWSGVPKVAGLGGWLAAAGRIGGLLAGAGVAVLVALMARLPLLERTAGAAGLARWNAAGRRSVTGLVVAHALLAVWATAIAGHRGVTGTPGRYLDLLTAVLAAVLLLGTGAMRVIRRWDLAVRGGLHGSGYAAGALAFSHTLADRAAVTASLPARIAWPVPFLAAAVVGWYRVAVPLRTAARHRFRVVGIRRQAPGIVSVYITGRDLDRLTARPGQLFRWRFLASRHWRAAYPGPPPAAAGGLIRVTIRQRGHARAMARLRPGTRVIAEGPFGRVVPVAGRRILLLVPTEASGGALRALLAAVPAPVLLTAPGITVLSLARTVGGPGFRGELDDIAAACGATVHHLTWNGGSPLTPGRLQALVPGLSRHEAYLSGPPGVTGIATTALQASGVPRDRIHLQPP